MRDHTHGRLDLIFDQLGVLSLKNISRPVEAFVVRLDGQAAEPAALQSPGIVRPATIGPQAPAPGISLTDKPSIAVLPFENMSGDRGQDYFVDGMVDEIITALSRIHWLSVIARTSTFVYKAQAVDVKQIGRELGVGYVLEGSVRKAGNRVRITGQSIDAGAGTHLWADRFDGLIDRALQLNPSYAHGWFVSGAIRLNAGQCDLAIEHIQHSLRLAPRDRLDAAFTFLGYACSFTRRFDEAAPKLLQAIEENPSLPWPYWALASCYAHMGQLTEARRMLERLRILTPAAAPRHVPWRNPDHREIFLSGLRMAAGEPT